MGFKKILILIVGFIVALGVTYLVYSNYVKKNSEPEVVKIIDEFGEEVVPKSTPVQTSFDPDFSNQEVKEYKGKVICLREFQGECVRGLKMWTGKTYELTRFDLRAGEVVQPDDSLIVRGYIFEAPETENTIIHVLEYEKE